MHNCVYTRLKSIISNKSLIYEDYCLEVNTSNKNKSSIVELKTKFNKEAPKELFYLIKNNLSKVKSNFM